MKATKIKKPRTKKIIIETVETDEPIKILFELFGDDEEY